MPRLKSPWISIDRTALASVTDIVAFSTSCQAASTEPTTSSGWACWNTSSARRVWSRMAGAAIESQRDYWLADATLQLALSGKSPGPISPMGGIQAASGEQIDPAAAE